MRVEFIIFVVYLLAPLTIGQLDLLLAPVAMAWNKALHYCNERNRNIVRIENSEKNDQVKDYAKQKGIKYYWVDANDKVEENKYVYSDNKPIEFQNWTPGTLTGGVAQNCLYADSTLDYKWDDWACDSGVSSVICDERYSPPVRYEFIVSPEHLAFDVAVNYCRERKRHLVRIENLEKNDRVANYTKSIYTTAYWIDANDKAEEGKFVYSDNRPIEFDNWRPGWPKGGVAANCVEAYEYTGYKWMDNKCDWTIWAICDKRNCSRGNYESIAERMTYNDAVKFCDKNHMDLVTTADAATNEKVFEYAQSKNLGSYWINGNDIDNESVWVDMYGDKLKFTNWDPIQSNGQYIENCIMAGYSTNAVWNDIPCQSKHSVICQSCQIT